MQKILTGHSIGVRSKYLGYTEEDLLQNYLLVANDLTINEENRLKTEVTELKKAKTEIETLKEQMKSQQEELDRALQQPFESLKPIIEKKIDDAVAEANRKMEESVKRIASQYESKYLEIKQKSDNLAAKVHEVKQKAKAE